MVKTLEYVSKSITEIKLPLHLDLGNKANYYNLLVHCGNGDNPFEMNLGSYVIDRTKEIKWHRKVKQIGERSYHYIVLDITCADGIKSLEFGAYMIKESMAALYQMQYDPSATHSRYDIPYNLVKIIAEKHFQNISNDDKKLISLCYISLFSMEPGVTLIEQLDYANNHPRLDGQTLLDRFIEESTIMDKETPYKVAGYFDILVDRFLDALDNSLHAPLDYIKEALNRVRLSKGLVPVIKTLYSQPFDEQVIQDLIDYVGVPYIYTDNHEYHYPQAVADPENAFADIIELIGLSAIYNYILGHSKYNCCPLKYMCLNTTFDKEECFDSLWKGHECSMTVVGGYFGFDKKDIHW